jgi:Icc-related predicted phosphoesterase
MLGFLGDIHGNTGTLQRAIIKAKEQGAAALIQVGDFGWYNSKIQYFAAVDYQLPVYWIDGNHENHKLIYESTMPHPNCIFVHRGTVLELDGKKIGFLGGAASVDKEMRLQGYGHWSDKELIEESDVAKLDNIEQLDILVTHTPPQSVIDKNFDPNNLRFFNLNPKTWFDPSARHVEHLWNRLNNPTLICGHMHKAVQDRTCRILNIDELMFL